MTMGQENTSLSDCMTRNEHLLSELKQARITEAVMLQHAGQRILEIDKYKSLAEKLAEALEKISKHQALIGGSMSYSSMTKRIADEALALDERYAEGMNACQRSHRRNPQDICPIHAKYGPCESHQ
jgi:hypothetical protein